jgi:glycosyltransferase involved in cell wall biosynthesis
MPDERAQGVAGLTTLTGGCIMRVCFVEDTDLHGGTQIWVVEATKNFLEAGVDVTVLTSESGWVAEQCAKTKATLVTYNYQAVVARDDTHRAIWTEALGNSDVAVCTVHPPRHSFHCSVFAAEVIEERGLETILVPKTGTIVPEYKRQFYLPKENIRSTVIAITDFTRKYLINTYRIPEEMIELIYQGTDVGLFTQSAERRREAQLRYPLPENAGPVLGNVGSFEERKGQAKLLEAMVQIKEIYPHVHLNLVGDGPDEEKLKRMVRDMDLSGNVTFFPFTPQPVYVYEVIDILVLASLYKEGLPNVLLEAMSMELPVVASRLAGVPEVVKDGETGYMVEPGNSSQVAEAVVKLWSDREAYSDMAQNARQLMVSKFDKKRQFGAFLSYFERILLDETGVCG